MMIGWSTHALLSAFLAGLMLGAGIVSGAALVRAIL